MLFIAVAGSPVTHGAEPVTGGNRPASDDIRYIFINIVPETLAAQSRPESFTPEMFKTIAGTINAPGNPHLRIGISFIFSLLEDSPETLEASLTRLLAACGTSGVPLMITLDGQNWWEKRPDLWNWWDTKMPGYDPANVENVEWTGWSPEQAVKVSWRNWGSQLRVRPAQNIMSPRVRAEVDGKLQRLVPVIVKWYRALPEDKRWLFGGIKLGWEAGIGYNAFYLPSGNAIYDASPDDASGDPQFTFAMDKGFSCGAVPIGYNAVKTAGLKSDGELTREDLAEVVRRYIEDLARTAHEAGMPDALIYVHQGGNYAPYEKHMPFSAAFNKGATPGWSFYFGVPETIAPLREQMEAAGRTRWLAAEWWLPGADADAWYANFDQTLRFMDCRGVVVYNWNKPFGLADHEEGQEALRRLCADWKE